MLDLGGGGVDISTPMGLMMSAVRAALAQMEPEIQRERIIDLVAGAWPDAAQPL